MSSDPYHYRTYRIVWYVETGRPDTSGGWGITTYSAQHPTEEAALTVLGELKGTFLKRVRYAEEPADFLKALAKNP